jgi:predicted GNAT family N-acyltransferase
MIISNSFTIAQVNKPDLLLQYYHFRWEQLRRPLGMAMDTVKDPLEDQSKHYATLYQGTIIAIGRLQQNNEDEYQIRYMAVDGQYQRHGLGSQLIAFIEKKAASMGGNHIVLNARSHAVSFYKKNSYKELGDPHMQIGIQHQKMIKNIS